MPQLKVQNQYRTTLTSSLSATGDLAFTVSSPPTYTNGFIVISPDISTQREVVYFHDVIGSTIYVRSENRISPKAHASTESIQMNDVAEIFNTYSDMISQAFYCEKIGGLAIKVWGGYVLYNGVQVAVADTNLTLTDNATNYVKYTFNTNTISSDTNNTGNIKAVITTLAGGITNIVYRFSKESLIDFTVALTGALPDQAGNAGKVLTTDGTNASWGDAMANASTTAPGAVEIATPAQSITATDTGETGAKLSVLPSDIAKNIQSGTFIYGADVGGDDAYVVALVPTLTTYTTGQVFVVKVTTANTGACTIDFGPGVKNIKMNDGTDPGSGMVSGVVTLIYNGTSFIIAGQPTFTTSGTYTSLTITRGASGISDSGGTGLLTKHTVGTFIYNAALNTICRVQYSADGSTFSNLASFIGSTSGTFAIHMNAGLHYRVEVECSATATGTSTLNYII